MYADDIADAVEQMWKKKMYRKILFISDTCKSESFFEQFSTLRTPNAVYMTSSNKEQNSLSSDWSNNLNVFLSDQFTSNLYKYFFQSHYSNEFYKHTIKDFVDFAR